MELPIVFAAGVLILRLCLLLSGVAFCWMGYRLFAHAARPGSAEISFKDAIKLNLHEVAPGVFFSLFGAAILIHGVSNAPELRVEAQPRDIPSIQPASSMVIAGARTRTIAATDPAERSRAGNQIALINRMTKGEQVSSEDHRELSRLSPDIRLAIMRNVWQEEWGDPAEFESALRDPQRSRPNAKALQFFERS